MTRSAGGCSFIAVFALVSMVTACSRARQPQPIERASVEPLVFLTREGCVNTVTMRANFDAALKALGWSNPYQFIDADMLAPSDPRGGYGTPTVLLNGRDLFDMPEPPVPHPPPT
ncbi:MAG: hypothetical protein K2Y23_06815 [Cyanobacteria bacterium]|nr:hypothetical protein [Cyanobacteriota bacterium]